MTPSPQSTERGRRLRERSACLDFVCVIRTLTVFTAGATVPGGWQGRPQPASWNFTPADAPHPLPTSVLPAPWV